MPKDKVSKFVEAINQEAEKKRIRIEQETEEFIKKEIEKAENEALEESFVLIQQKVASVREDIGRELSMREIESRKRLFVRREEITKEIFSAAEEKIKAFTQTDGYLPLLKNLAKKAAEMLGGPKVILFIRKEDISFAKDLQKIDPRIEIREDDSIALGGIIAQNAEGTILLKDTLEARLYAKRAWFEENSGLTIT